MPARWHAAPLPIPAAITFSRPGNWHPWLSTETPRLGFLYEHGFGEPQDYDAAADFYARGAVQGDPFAQAMLGLMYDKGHGVPLDVIFAYKWLNLAAARSQDHERETFARLRDAVASKMSKDEIAEGQRLALNWTERSFDPSLRAERGTWKSRHPPE